MKPTFRSGVNETFYISCLIFGQLLLTLSTFFWEENGRYSINASVMIILSMTFWIVGFQYLLTLFSGSDPWYSRLGLVYAIYGCVGGIAFGFEGLYSEVFGYSDKMGVEAYSRFPMQMNLVLFWSGPAFPLSILLIGIMLIVRKMVPAYVGIWIALGGIAFPVSRIIRIEWIAHLSDVLLLSAVIILPVLLKKKADLLKPIV